MVWDAQQLDYSFRKREVLREARYWLGASTGVVANAIWEREQVSARRGGRRTRW